MKVMTTIEQVRDTQLAAYGVFWDAHQKDIDILADEFKNSIPPFALPLLKEAFHAFGKLAHVQGWLDGMRDLNERV